MNNGMKSTKPVSFGGQRDAFKINIWLYKIDVYFDLLSI